MPRSDAIHDREILVIILNERQLAGAFGRVRVRLALPFGTPAMRLLKPILLWSGLTLVALIALAATLIIWPDPLFAYSAGAGKITVHSDRPIPAAGGEKFLRDCEALLAR